MKTTTNLKGLVVISSFALFATAYPTFAQSSSDSSKSSAAQDQSSQLSSGSSTSSGAQSSPSSASSPSSSSQSRDLSSQNYGTPMNEPAGANNVGNNWGWIGLIGLVGLFGLKRHSEADDTYRPITRPGQP